MHLTDKKITVLGGKRSGMAVARLAVRLGAKAKISDQGNDSCLSTEFKDWASRHHVALEFNGHTRECIEDSDVLVLSPGVRLDAAPVGWARNRGILVLGEIEFAAQFCLKPIIAVTGSNGKTTVSTLIRDILQAGGHRARLCGNVGFPFSEFVLDLAETDVVVLEISSFQLESVIAPGSSFRALDKDHPMYVEGFRPHVAVILNFNQNHLDRHKDLDEYFDAKKRIFLNQTADNFILLNDQDPRVKGLAGEPKSKVVYFNCPPDREKGMNPNHSAVMEVGKIWGVGEDVCRKVFREFAGVEHRMERVRTLEGVDYINDSKATTAESGAWALNSLNRPVLMICGGRDKNIDFSVLTGLVTKKVKKMFVIGEARKKLRRAFGDLVELEECDGLADAVAKARGAAAQGDCVLLSPMCASFDMFKDFEDRGRSFKEVVNSLDGNRKISG